MYFVLFKRQAGQTKDSFSLVDSETYKSIPKKIIADQKRVPNKLYSKEEMKKLLISLGGDWYDAS